MTYTTAPGAGSGRARARAGDVLKGRYEIVDRINAGSMSCVHKAWDRQERRFIVVKTADDERSAGDVERLRREGGILSTLRHPRIPRAFDAGDDGPHGYWIAIEFIAGASIATRLEHEGFLPVREAVRAAVETCEALEAAHAAGIVHRDVKPENLMETDGGAMLIDFGIAAYVPLRRARRLTLPGVAVGTPSYMAPEQCRCEEGLDGRADLYALGLALYVMLTGCRAIGGDDAIETMRAQLLLAPTPFMRTAPGLRLPKRLEDAVMRAIEKRPDDRFRNASEMREELLAAVP